MSEPKYFKISLLSSLLTMLPAVIFFVFAGLTGSSVLENGEVDNDPMRAGWALLFLSPVIYTILAIFFYIISRLLFWLGKLQFQYFELFVFLVSAWLSYSIAYDSLRMFLTCFLIFSMWLSIGTASWFYFGILRYNKRLKHDALKRAS